MSEIIDLNNPPPAPPPGPPPDPHSEATAMARLRALRPAAEAPPAGEPEPNATVRGPDGKFARRATEAPAAETAPETTAEDAAPVEAQAEDEGEGEAQISVATIQDLAEHLGVEVADLYNLRVPVEIDGGREEVSLSDFKDRYRDAVKLSREQAEIKTARERLEAETKAREAALAQREMAATHVLNTIEQSINQQFAGIDWNTLRTQNPEEWSALRIDYAERMNTLRQMREQASQQYEAAKRQSEAEDARKKQEHLARERDALLKALPEWKDPKIAETERSRLRDYAQRNGYTQEELDAMGDHRAVIALRKAMLYDEAGAKAQAAKKSVVTIGKKVLKPSPRAGAPAAGATQVKTLIAKASKSGDWRDALEALKASRRQGK